MKFIHLRFWRSEVRRRSPWARIKALARRVLSGGSRGEPLPSPSFQRLLTLLRVGKHPDPEKDRLTPTSASFFNL